jgi:hypothetical protein
MRRFAEYLCLIRKNSVRRPTWLAYAEFLLLFSYERSGVENKQIRSVIVSSAFGVQIWLFVKILVKLLQGKFTTKITKRLAKLRKQKLG